MKKILFYLIAILSPFIFISKVNAEITFDNGPKTIKDNLCGGGYTLTTYNSAIDNTFMWGRKLVYGSTSGEIGSCSVQMDFYAYTPNNDYSKYYDITGIIGTRGYSNTGDTANFLITLNGYACTVNNYTYTGITGTPENPIYTEVDGYFSYTCTNVKVNQNPSDNEFIVTLKRGQNFFFWDGMNYTATQSNVITQNEIMIQGQEEIKEYQEQQVQQQQETNDALTSDSEDESSSSCGMICKLKNILSYINPLSEKFFAYKLVELLIDALKSLIVPDDMSFVTDFVDALESKLGFIGAIPGQIIEFAINLVSASWTEFNSISFPSISIFGYNFWDSQEIDLTEAINIFKPFKYVTDCICVVLCARTLNKWREQFTGGSSE